MNSQALAVFGRHPSPGRVKTRLAATIGNQSACDFYKKCTETVLKQLLRCEDTAVQLFVADVCELTLVEKWMADVGLSVPIMGQLQSENLGDRIFHSLKHLKLSGYPKVAAVATDVPDMTHTIVQQGLQLLDRYDVVLGPAVDGGFYFLGVNDITKELFDDVEWSTSSVYEKVVSNALKLHLSVAPVQSLPPVPDIDTFQDLCLWTQLPHESDPQCVAEMALERLTFSENHR